MTFRIPHGRLVIECSTVEDVHALVEMLTRLALDEDRAKHAAETWAEAVEVETPEPESE